MLEEECEELEVATLVEVVVLGARGIVALNHGLLHAEEMIRKQSGNKFCVGNEISIDITGLRGLRISRAKVGQQEIKEKFKIHAGNTRFYFVTEDMIHDTKKTIAHHGSRDDVLSFISRLVTRRVELPHIGPIIISGESGAGKSFLLSNLFMSFPGISVIIRARGGSDHIRSCIQKVESEHVHVIMVDDVDVLERVSLDDDSAKELILSIRSLSKKIVVYSCTSISSVSSRFLDPHNILRSFLISRPSSKIRKMLIEEKLRELIGNHISTQTCQSIVEGTMGLHAGAIMKVCREFAILTKSEPHENEHQIVMHAISNISRFYTFELSRPLTPISWEEIGGYQLVVKRLRHIVSQWEYSSEEGSERKNFLFSSCKGVLLIGPSGCGKTFLARAVSGQRGLNFINFNISDIFSKYFGESEAKIRALFAKARLLSPCVIFFDEIDAIGKSRQKDDQGSLQSMQKRILSTLLNELDGIGTQANSQVYILAATNDPERLDSALIRPGRIDVVLTLDHPSDSCLKDIFTKATEEMPLENGVSFSTITEFSPELSELALTCADIVQICQNAAMCAFYDERDLILKTDFQKASSQFLHNLTSLY